MKTFSIAVVVAIMLAFTWIQEGSAAPSTEMEEPEIAEIPLEFKEDVPADSWALPYYRSREKRGIKCKFCCDCCTPGVCGVCCRF